MNIEDDYGGMLSDKDIRHFWGKGIEVTCNEKGKYAFDINSQLKYGSIDLRFQRQYYKFSDTVTSVTFESTQNKEYLVPKMLTNDEPLILKPGEIVLTSTSEIIRFSPAFAGIITGRSSIARLGIMVQCCQEFINPGQGQSIALQIVNLSKNIVVLDRSVPICQLVIFKLRTPASNAYQNDKESKYTGNVPDSGASKIYLEAKGTSAASIPKNNNGIYKKAYKCFEPFIPSVVILLLITPWINSNLVGKSIGEFIKEIIKEILGGAQSISISFIFGILLFIIVVINKWRESKG